MSRRGSAGRPGTSRLRTRVFDADAGRGAGLAVEAAALDARGTHVAAVADLRTGQRSEPSSVMPLQSLSRPSQRSARRGVRRDTRGVAAAALVDARGADARHPGVAGLAADPRTAARRRGSRSATRRARRCCDVVHRSSTAIVREPGSIEVVARGRRRRSRPARACRRGRSVAAAGVARRPLAAVVAKLDVERADAAALASSAGSSGSRSACRVVAGVVPDVEPGDGELPGRRSQNTPLGRARPPPRVSTSPHHGAIIGWSATGNGFGVNVDRPRANVMLPLLLTNTARYVARETQTRGNAAATSIARLEPSSFGAEVAEAEIGRAA